ncbi:hypothetical protein EMPS_04679 [Entomortierella parvispora]|uniref:UBA domain-containing protein n=1 Tax=Entomortierella parvispora TaxID=205924 RepID=A0A9P3LVR7_9FUNG|nr:hypothetical protein EMPS_04679 [Entomortierella parvispora]
MDSRLMALEKVTHPIHITFSFPPYPKADPRTIDFDLPEGALLLDAIRQVCLDHHIPVYLEQSLLATAEGVIQSTRRDIVANETKHVNQTLFMGKGQESSANDTPTEDTQDLDEELLKLQQAMVQTYRSHTSQFHTQPEENLFPEAYHTLVHSPIPSLFDAILDLEREYSHEVNALLSARDAEFHVIQIKHNQAIANEQSQRGQQILTTRHVERMQVAQATWNSQLDDLQTFQRSKYREFILELYSIYKRQQPSTSRSKGKEPAKSAPENGPLDGKDMVAEALKAVGARRSNIGGTAPPKVPPRSHQGEPDTGKDLPQTPVEAQTEPTAPSAPTPAAAPAPVVEEVPPPPPPKAQPKEDIELDNMVKSILEMGFDVEQAKGALLISNRNMDHAINLLLEQPENIPRLVLAKQKVDAMKENARNKSRAQSSPQQPHPSLASNSTPAQVNPALVHPQAERPLDRSSSVSSPRPHIPGMNQPGAPVQKAWSPLPFLQQQKNALLTNNSNPSVKKFGGWLNKAIENLGLDDDIDGNYSGSSRNSTMAGSSFGPAHQPPASNLAESFTVSLGSSHSKVTHNLRLTVSDPALVFPTHRVKSEQDDAIHAQTASSLYGQNLTGLVQLVNIQDWAKYKSGLVCHQEFFEACQTSTELHFDTIEKQLEALEDEMPLDCSTIQEGDFILTRHSNLPMIHVVFHLFYGQASSTPTENGAESGPSFSQSSDFVPKPEFLTGLRNILRAAHRYDITMLSLPFLMMPEAFESQFGTVAPHRGASTGGIGNNGAPSRNMYGSPPMSTVSTTSSPSASSTSSFSTIGGPGFSSQPSDQIRKDLHRRAETLLRHLKSYLMDNARQVKQVGNQGSEAEKFRASQGGDVKVVQFLLPRGTSDEMFRNYRALLTHVFGGA